MPSNRKMVHVYVTEEEKKNLQVRARKAGLSLSKYLLLQGLQAAPQVAAPRAPTKRTTESRVKVSKPDRSLEQDPLAPVVAGRGFQHHESTIEKRKRLGKL